MFVQDALGFYCFFIFPFESSIFLFLKTQYPAPLLLTPQGPSHAHCVILQQTTRLKQLNGNAKVRPVSLRQCRPASGSLIGQGAVQGSKEHKPSHFSLVAEFMGKCFNEIQAYDGERLEERGNEEKSD